MKAKYWMIFAALIIAGSLFFSYAKGQAASTDTKITAMLDSFYRSYITAVAASADSTGSAAALSSLTQQYCTDSLLSKINTGLQAGTLDYDPFINAQDATTASLASLSIKKSDSDALVYVVSYTDAYTKKSISINVTVVVNGDDIKINALQ